MNDEKAIEQLEEFLVIDDWSAVYMPYLQDAIEYVINRIKTLAEKPQGDLISRSALINGMQTELGLHDEENGSEPLYMEALEDVENLIKKISSRSESEDSE